MTLNINGLAGIPGVVSNLQLLINPDREPVRIILSDGTEIEDWYGDEFKGDEPHSAPCRFHREEVIRMAISRAPQNMLEGTCTTGGISVALSRIQRLIRWTYSVQFIENIRDVELSGELFRIFGIDANSHGHWHPMQAERLLSVEGSDWYIVDDLRHTDQLSIEYGGANVLVYHNGLRLVRQDVVDEGANILELRDRMNAVYRPPSPDSWLSYLLHNSGDWNEELAHFAGGTIRFYRGNSSGDLRHSSTGQRYTSEATYSQDSHYALSITDGSEEEIFLWVRTYFDDTINRHRSRDFGLSKILDGTIQYKVLIPEKLGLTLDGEVARTNRERARNRLTARIIQMTERAFRSIAFRDGFATPLNFNSGVGFSGSGRKTESFLSDSMWVKITRDTVVGTPVLSLVRELNWW